MRERKRRTVTSEGVWDAAREDYIEGASGSCVAERYGVGQSAVHKRAARGGWNRERLRRLAAAGVIAEAPPAAPTDQPAVAELPAGGASEAAPCTDPLPLTRIALAKAVAAQARNRPHEAMAHVKAALAIGNLSDVLAALEQGAGEA